MKRRRWLQAALGAGAALSLGATGAPRLRWRERLLLGFGTTLRLKAAHEDLALLGAALDEAVALLRRIEAQMSLFDPSSALCRLNREGRLADPPGELLQLLRLARDVSAASGGGFDVTVQPLWQAYALAQRQGRLPTRAEIATARARVDWRRLRIADTELRFTMPGMAATLNGIAQGYAADRVRQLLQQRGIAHALIDTGEHATLGRNPADQPWALAVADPRDASRRLARLLADGRCIATSADDASSFSADHRHHHILDPRTGASPPALASVTVAAPSGALADALTKVMFMAGPGEALALASQWRVDLLLVDKRGRVQTTPGLRVA